MNSVVSIRIDAQRGGICKGGPVVIDGHDIARSVRALRIDSRVGDLTVLELELVKVDFESFEARGVPVIRYAKDGWHQVRVATPEILGLMARLHHLIDEAVPFDGGNPELSQRLERLRTDVEVAAGTCSHGFIGACAECDGAGQTPEEPEVD